MFRLALARRLGALAGLLLSAPACGDAGAEGAEGAEDESTTSASPDPLRGYGEACRDAGCDGELECVVALEGGAGELPGGACAARCDDDASCPEGAVCAGGVCFLACFPGAAANQRCPARPDMACTPTSALATSYACIPLCHADVECPAGKTCSPATGTCVDAPASGAPTGSACDPAASACAGVCLDAFGAGAGVCTQPCSAGSPHACGGQASCFVATPGPTAGDLGACTKPCVRHDDCSDPSLFCFTGSCLPAKRCATPDECPTFEGEPLKCLVEEATGASVCLPEPA